MTAGSGAALDVNHLRSWIGREERIVDVVGADLVAKFRATFDQPGGRPRSGETAPRLIHFCLGQPAALTGTLGPDGHPARGGFLPPVPLPRRMWAGGSLTFHDDLKVGDEVLRRSRIANVSRKDGRTGPLCFVTVQHLAEVGGRTVIEERQDIVYRGADPQPTRGPHQPAPAAAHCRRFDASPTMLFRYSALTFNGHRIHYDRRNATEVEGYPGLVVHGPLQATLLLQFAAELRGAPPARFSFRSLSPLFDDDTCLLNASEAGNGLSLWTARAGGPVAMAAEAHWT